MINSTRVRIILPRVNLTRVHITRVGIVLSRINLIRVGIRLSWLNLTWVDIVTQRRVILCRVAHGKFSRGINTQGKSFMCKRL